MLCMAPYNPHRSPTVNRGLNTLGVYFKKFNPGIYFNTLSTEPWCAVVFLCTNYEYSRSTWSEFIDDYEISCTINF